MNSEKDIQGNIRKKVRCNYREEEQKLKTMRNDFIVIEKSFQLKNPSFFGLRLSSSIVKVL